MHKNITALCALLITSPILQATESFDSYLYLQPKLSYLFMNEGPQLNADQSHPYPEHEFKDAPALGLSTGFNLTKNHAIELEVTYFKTETKDYSSYYSPSYLYADPKGKLQGIPLLVGYKYTNKLKDQWSWYAVTSAGITFYKLEIISTFLGYDIPGYSSPPGVYTRVTKSSSFTFASDIGNEYKFNDRSKITLGLKLMLLDQGHDTTPGFITSVNLGYAFSF